MLLRQFFADFGGRTHDELEEGVVSLEKTANQIKGHANNGNCDDEDDPQPASGNGDWLDPQASDAVAHQDEPNQS